MGHQTCGLMGFRSLLGSVLEALAFYHQLDGYEFEQTLGQWRTEEPGKLQPMGPQRVGHKLATE